jgi:hypothetical protein
LPLVDAHLAPSARTLTGFLQTVAAFGNEPL